MVARACLNRHHVAAASIRAGLARGHCRGPVSGAGPVVTLGARLFVPDAILSAERSGAADKAIWTLGRWVLGDNSKGAAFKSQRKCGVNGVPVSRACSIL